MCPFRTEFENAGSVPSEQACIVHVHVVQMDCSTGKGLTTSRSLYLKQATRLL